MPHRWLAVLIVLFWLTTSGVFFWHEYWPYLEPGAPPPFAIDLVDEAQNSVFIRWDVSHNGERILTANTNVEHTAEENTFTLIADFTPAKADDKTPRPTRLPHK